MIDDRGETARQAAAGGRAARDPSRANAPARPGRPILVELAAAWLIIGGVLSVLLTIETLTNLADAGSADGGLAVLTLLIGIGIVVLGLLVRTGRAWLVTVNAAAILGFLELSSLTAQGLLFGALDVFVVLALFRERPWFAWRSEQPEADSRP